MDGARLAAWATVGDPVGLAVGGSSVWVVGGAGDNTVSLADPNTVVQLDVTTGLTRYKYPVEGAQAVATNGDSAWVVTSGIGSKSATLLRLNQGHTTLVATLSGQLASNPGFTGDALAICPSGIYVATITNSSTAVSQVSMQTAISQQLLSVSGSGGASLACNSQSLFLAVEDADHGGIYPLPASRSSAVTPFGPRSPSDLAVVATDLWVVDQTYGDGPGRVSLFNASSAYQLAQVKLPLGDARLLAADSSGTWVVAGSNLLELQSIPQNS
jgi:hypothetical protein